MRHPKALLHIWHFLRGIAFLFLSIATNILLTFLFYSSAVLDLEKTTNWLKYHHWNGLSRFYLFILLHSPGLGFFSFSSGSNIDT